MPLTNRDRSFGSFYVPSITSGVKWLLAVNVGIYLLMFLAELFRVSEIFVPLGLVPYSVVNSFAIWQPFTYMFLHGSLLHVLINMLMLWMFGCPVEGIWGRRRFLRYYFLCGIGAGVCAVAWNYALGSPKVWTIGASGAIYGLLIAFGLLYADSIILFMFIFPMKAKWAAFLYGGIAFFMTVRESGGPVSNIAHLGGFLTGLAIMKLGMPKLSLNPIPSMQQRYKDWKFQRAKKKFQVYLRKKHNHGDPDRWTN